MPKKKVISNRATGMGRKVPISAEKPGMMKHNAMKTMPAGVPSKTHMKG